MFWVYQPFWDGTTLWTLKVTAADLTATGLTTSSIDHVTLSGDKAFFHYDGGKFMIWKMHQDGAAKIVYQANNSGIPTTGDMQYKVTLNCLCQALKRFFCSSATLACVIIKKGNDNCFNEDTLSKFEGAWSPYTIKWSSIKILVKSFFLSFKFIFVIFNLLKIEVYLNLWFDYYDKFIWIFPSFI